MGDRGVRVVGLACVFLCLASCPEGCARNGPNENREAGGRVGPERATAGATRPGRGDQPGTAPSAAAGLFLPVAATQDLNDQQQTILAHVRNEPATASVRLTRIDKQAFDGAGLNLNLGPSVNVRATRTADQRDDARRTWVGELPEGNAIFTVRGDNVTGSITGQDGLYKVIPLGGGLHAVVKQDPSKYPPEEPPSFRQKQRNVGPGARVPPVQFDATARPTADTAAAGVLDVMVLYTPAVANAVADVDGLIAQAVKETNVSYQNSGIALTLALVKSARVDYRESGDFQIDLDRLAGKADGFMDEIHAMRDQAKADVVVMLINDHQYCGLADAILADEASAFAVVDYSCATGNLSFGHEIGHLQGARHDPDNDDGSPFTYGHGYVNNVKHWRTVMAYNGVPASVRLPYWSSPLISYNGDPTGNPTKYDNARVLRETIGIVTRFR